MLISLHVRIHSLHALLNLLFAEFIYYVSLLPKTTVRFRIPSYVPHLRPSFPVRYPTPLDQISFLSMFGKTINFCMVINLNLRQLWTLISLVPCALGRQRQFLIWGESWRRCHDVEHLQSTLRSTRITPKKPYSSVVAWEIKWRASVGGGSEVPVSSLF